MVLVCDIVTLIITSIIMIKMLRSIFRREAPLIVYVACAFYAVQVVPVFFRMLFGNPYIYTHINTSKAMNDVVTQIVYDGFVIIVLLFFYYYNVKTINKKNRRVRCCNNKVFPNPQNRLGLVIRCLIIIMMFSPIMGVLLSPNPIVYTEIGYFFSHAVEVSDSYVYHTSVMKVLLYASCIATAVGYYNKNEESGLIYYLAIAMITLIDGKRTLMLFMVVFVIASDFLRGRFYRNKRKQIFKTLCLALIVLGYFLYYNYKTGKGVTYEFYFLYTFYFSRMSIVETSIYDMLYTRSLLDYPLQTLIFNLFMWIPRFLWPSKPVMYCIYFTSYADGYPSSARLNYNLQVNMWSEFISNAGILGVICGMIFIYWIVNTSEKQGSLILKYIGVGFSVLYTVYGFEHVVSYLFYVWIAYLVLIKTKIRIKL